MRGRKSGKPTRAESATQSLMDRSLTDDNFAHTIRLLGACAAWSEAIEEGHVVDFNDRNLIQIPIELALAFAKAHASEQSPVGEACHETLKLLDAFRAAGKPDRSNEPAVTSYSAEEMAGNAETVG